MGFIRRYIERQITAAFIIILRRLDSEIFLAECDINKTRTVIENKRALEKRMEAEKNPAKKADLQAAVNRLYDYYGELLNDQHNVHTFSQHAALKLALQRIIKRLQS